ncbi:histidinol-phosphate transaminase [Salinibacterium sp. M195]|uniref:histidinol-phosphate transaminase n=1 Tax=Salinibacterium sp. M195 TaxID=2583374 RepID=UPI001C62FCD9|nr:histidinol-phosphate transaminase [Salinibacterium sp. M195]QYH34908.1 aminotransferase class I/II-fold pyridoxal phosphate-dependent enzyme [Salinibacterium sp. M195]
MTSNRVQLRPEIAAIVPYRQGSPAAADSFKLSSNENPYEPLPSVLAQLSTHTINRYPDASAAELRRQIAARFDVNADSVQVGAGSVAVLAQLVSAAAASGDEVVYAWRSFEAYPLLVSAAGATSVQIANQGDHRHDLAKMSAAITESTRVVIVCSPNNPTSTVVTDAEFRDFMASVPENVLVVLDEAYREFVTDPAAVRGETLVGQYPNLVLLRTFSKAYGLAGLRIGYAIGPEYVMDAARAVAIPLSVTELAQTAAIASLEHEDELLERVSRLNGVRESIVKGLREQGWDVPTPSGNFVWLPTGAATSWAAEVFRSHGIVVRALGEGLRVSVGEEESVEKLLRAAQEVVASRETN